MHGRNFKIFFSRTTGPISTKLSTMHPWVMGIQVYSNEGSHPFPKEDNYEKWKYIDEILKSSSPEPLGQFQPNKAESILGWRRFKFVQVKDPTHFQGEIITKITKIHWRNLKKYSSPEPLSQFQPILAQSILGWGFKWKNNKLS